MLSRCLWPEVIIEFDTFHAESAARIEATCSVVVPLRHDLCHRAIVGIKPLECCCDQTTSIPLPPVFFTHSDQPDFTDRVVYSQCYHSRWPVLIAYDQCLYGEIPCQGSPDPCGVKLFEFASGDFRVSCETGEFTGLNGQKVKVLNGH